VPPFVGSLPDTGDVWGIAFSPDGQLVATAGGNSHTVSLWSAGTGELVRMMSGRAVVNDVAFSPDSTRVATTAGLYDATTGDDIRELGGGGYSVTFSPDGKHLAVGSGYELSPGLGTRLFDSVTGDLVRAISGEYARAVAFNSDGTILASATGYLHEGVRLWNPVTGERIWTLGGSSHAVAFSPDGKLTATGGGGIVQLWDEAHGGHIRDIAGNNLLAFSPDGKLLTADKNGALRLYDPITGVTIRALTGAYAKTAEFSPDGRRIAVITPNNVAALIGVEQHS
jgi:Tol biopolymer transport system component